ncbi:hypothetical protein BD779DRAFT_1569100 [Infundibulicybe gibba]|nr:hypothetical protein BD779DRAFT_1569100 [Infundibulicybe gibba]
MPSIILISLPMSWLGILSEKIDTGMRNTVLVRVTLGRSSGCHTPPRFRCLVIPIVSISSKILLASGASTRIIGRLSVRKLDGSKRD